MRQDLRVTGRASQLTDSNAVTALRSSASEGSELEKLVNDEDMSTEEYFWRTILGYISFDLVDL